MSFYQRRILPHLVDLSMRQATLTAYRERTVPAAERRVLEIGVGSCLNLPFYADRATQLIGLDPSPKLLSMARKAAGRIGRHVELLEGSAEDIPLEPTSIDTVVITWTLCSIPNVTGALREMRRVLRADGHLLFVEHSRSPDAGVRRWQDRLTPLWSGVRATTSRESEQATILRPPNRHLFHAHEFDSVGNRERPRGPSHPLS